MKNKGQNCKTSVTFSWLLAISALDSKDCLLLIKYVLITQLLKYILRLKHMYCLYKVVGGMVWCLELCAVDVDVNFLFRENLNIGEKMWVLIIKIVQCIILFQKHFNPLLEKSLKKSSKFYCQSSVLMPLNPIKSKVLTQ